MDEHSSAEFWRITLLFASLFVRPASAEKRYVRCLPIAGRNNMDRDLPETLSHARHLLAEQLATPQAWRSGRRPGICFRLDAIRPLKTACSECTTESSCELPELGELLRHLYEGRLTERNRSMVVLSNRRGLTCSVTCRFLGIDRHTYRKYLRTFEHAGVSAYSPPKRNRIASLMTIQSRARFLRFCMSRLATTA